MKDQSKTKQRLITELEELRRKIAEIEALEEEHRRSEAALGQLAAIVQSSDDAIIGKTLEGIILSWNQGAERIYGYSSSEIIGHHISILVPHSHPDEVSEFLKRIGRGERIERFETMRRRKDSQLIHVSLTISPVKDRTGTIVGASTIASDITERRKAEEALRRSEEEAKKFAQEDAVMAEIGRIISLTLNIEEVYERFSEEVRKLISFDRISINIINPEGRTGTVAYAIGVDVIDRRPGSVFPLIGSMTEEVMRARSGLLIQTEDRDELKTRYPGLLTSFQAGLRSMMSVPLISKDQVIGSLHIRSLTPNAYTELDMKLAERVGNQIAGAITNAQLFIERKQAEEALRKSEAHLQLQVDRMPIGCIMWDPEFRVLSWNPAAERIFGLGGRSDRETSIRSYRAEGCATACRYHLATPARGRHHCPQCKREYDQRWSHHHL